MSYGQAQYNNTGNALRDRILALIPTHPEIMTCDGPGAIFKIAPEFKCDDLQPSMFQAQWALAAAREAYREGKRG